MCVPKRANKTFYSEITTAYDSQIDTINDNVEIVFNPAEIDDKMIVVAERYGSFADVWVSSDTSVYDTNAKKADEYQKMTGEFFNRVVGDCALRVQAEYNDGTVETQKLTYKADVQLETAPLTFHTDNGDETKNVYIAKINLNAKLV